FNAITLSSLMAYSLLSIGIDDFEDHQEYATSFSLHTQLIVITLRATGGIVRKAHLKHPPTTSQPVAASPPQTSCP
ncbi:MAG: hypothetical protein ACREU9_13705, partial [Gammaproteobacteria bacterium]